jgi:hypothetical protein
MSPYLWLLVLSLVLSGCLKSTPPVAAPTAVPVRVAVVLESFDDTDIEGAPASVVEQITAELHKRNLVPQVVPVDPSFATVRSTEGRLDRLEGDGVGLLVECAPRFSAQVNGRYRWSVQVEATLDDGRADEVRRSFKVPVHLIYDHQEEAAALAEAAPIVARQVGLLLDEWIDVTTAE